MCCKKEGKKEEKKTERERRQKTNNDKGNSGYSARQTRILIFIQQTQKDLLCVSTNTNLENTPKGYNR